MNRRIFVLFGVLIACLRGQDPAGATMTRAIRDAVVDSSACYRVRELNFTKEDLKFYLTDGYLIFAKPVLGRRLFAIFSGDVEGGDAEVLLMPPHRGERRSLATFVDSPNLAEHFKTALFLFSDGTREELLQQAEAAGHKNLELGALMKDRWGSLARNISNGFEVRLVGDLLSDDRESGLFFAAIAGNTLGNFDLVCDPASRDQIMAGQYADKNGRPAFDVWTAFESRSVRSGRKQPPRSRYTLSNYRIDATLDANLHLAAVTRATLEVRSATRAITFGVSDRMQVTQVVIDGRPAHLYETESVRESAIRGGFNTAYLVLTDQPLTPGATHEIEIRHDGDVVVSAGNNVYLVTSRGNWYPRTGIEFANYDLTFRYPRNLTLVATGEPVEDRVEGDVRISRRKTAGPVRVAGFNLGQYEEAKLTRPELNIEVFGNKRLEPQLQPPTQIVVVPSTPRILRGPDLVSIPPPVNIKPTARLSELAENISGAFDFMRSIFGPAPIRTLTVSPIPGAFGQGFPGLVYLSTLAYLRADERPKPLRTPEQAVFFDELMPAHEVAHQWVGNYLAPAGYQDDWLMEALANYASLEYLEKRRGVKIIEPVLDNYLANLLRKQPDGRTMESFGPIVLGMRLRTSQSEEAWRTITYEKGAWILHMLRRRMGDDRFHKFLAEMCRRYATESISTENFRRLAEEIMGAKPGSEPLSEFFDSWVYGTGIPTLKVAYTVKGKAPALTITGTVTQSGVDEEFATEVPVEIHYGKGAPATIWVKTGSDPAPFTVKARQAPLRVTIPAWSVLALRK